MEKLVLGIRIFFISVFVVPIAWLLWIIIPLLKERKKKKEEPKKELKKFILVVSNGDTIQFARELPLKAKEEEIERAKEKCRGDLGEGREIHLIEAECKDSAVFKLASQLRKKTSFEPKS